MTFLSNPKDRNGMGEKLLSFFITITDKHKVFVLLLGLGIGLGSAYFTIQNCEINTNTEDMLSEKLQWRVDYAKFKETFPQLTDTLLIFIESDIPELAREAGEILKKELDNNSTDFEFVSYPESSDFFRKNLFLYMESNELEKLINRLSESQALLGLLAKNPNLETVLEIFRQLIEQGNEENRQSLKAFFDVINTSLLAYTEEQQVPISWQQLLDDDSHLEKTQVIIFIKPRLNFHKLLPAESAINFIDNKIENLGYADHNNLQIFRTGGAALNHDELISVTKGAKKTGIVALVCVTVILFIGLRSATLIAATLINLMIGLACTAGFATVAVGTLNMISIAFAILYVGLAVDFAIHICLRYQEYCNVREKKDAIRITILELGRSISLCAFTTSIGFLAFVPTDYKGVAELGLISGVGMLLSLLTSLTILPALLGLLPTPKCPPRKTVSFFRSMEQGIYDKRILVFSALLCGFSCLFIQDIEFDNNPINLNDQKAESVVTLKRLSSQSGELTSSLSVLVRDAVLAKELAKKIESNQYVESVSSVFDLVPKEQYEKIDLIDELNLIMGGALNIRESETSSKIAVLKKIELLIEILREKQPSFTQDEELIQFDRTLQKLHARISTRDIDNADIEIKKIERIILKFFPRLTKSISNAMEAETFDLISIPSEFKNLWWNEEGVYRLEVHPAVDPYDNQEMTKFIQSVRSISGRNVTGVPVINLEAGKSVIEAFRQALISAVILICFVIWIVLRKPLSVLVLMTPLFLASLLTVTLTVWLNIPFNFANIIALPLLMGIGVDSSIHIFHRHSMSAEKFGFYQSSTSRAVIFSSLTTAASFGSLAVSPHAGTASLGVLLALSLSCIVVCALGLLPALIRKTDLLWKQSNAN